MKKIEIITRKEKLEEIKEELFKINIEGITISQVMGCGKQLGWKEYYRGQEVTLNILPKIKLELVVKDNKVESIINKIVSIAKTGEVGDGKIFITDVVDSIRIRTGERGEDAI